MREKRSRNCPPAAGLARALSKLGYCSRTQALAMIRAGRVRLNGAVSRDPETGVDLERDRIEVDGRPVAPAVRVYLMLNKPRGVVTSAADEKGRRTVYDCLREVEVPWFAPVGRLDKASEGLLLLTNDTRWAARILAPESRLEKTYHVQVDCLADEALLRRIEHGITTVEGEFLGVRRVRILRHGRRNSWLEVVLDQGRNRHIRRLLAALGVDTLRLVRVGVGPVRLGDLARGACRHLTEEEREALRGGSMAQSA
jgi:23S rRNA pseudouridine2605 synthase